MATWRTVHTAKFKTFIEELTKVDADLYSKAKMYLTTLTNATYNELHNDNLFCIPRFLCCTTS